MVLGGLILLRLPRLLGVEVYVWAVMLPLLPFWFSIVMNEFGHLLHRRQAKSRLMQGVYTGLFSINFIGGLFILYTALVYSLFSDSTWFILLGSLLLLGALYLLYRFGRGLLEDKDVHPVVFLIGVSAFLLMVVSVFRTASLNPVYFLTVIDLMTLLIFGISFRKKFNDERDESRFLLCWIAGMNGYLILNLVLYLVGVANPEANYLRAYEAVMLGMLGIDTSRIYFPMAEGINAYGIFAGSVLAVNAVYLWAKRGQIKDQKGWFAFLFIGAVSAAVSVIGADSRSALLFAGVITGLLLWQKPAWYPYFAGGFLLVQAGGLLSRKMLSGLDFAGRLLRQGTDVLSGRPFIWQQALDQLGDFNWNHLIGYGMFGQTISGVVNEYQHLFKSYLNKDQIPLHSFILQTIFDLGYLGLLVMAVFLVAMVIVFSKKITAFPKISAEYQAAVGFLLYCLLMGSVSGVPSIYAPEIFFLFIMAWVSAL